MYWVVLSCIRITISFASVDCRHTLQYGKRNGHKLAARDLDEGIYEYKRVQEVTRTHTSVAEEVVHQFKEFSREVELQWE